MINGAQVPLLCPTHAHTTHVKKNQALPPSPSSLAAKSTMGAAEARRGAADRSDRGRRGDPACGRRADQHRLSGDPQADRAVCLCWPQARQGAGRDMAAIRRAVPYLFLFHWHDPARIACRAGAGREFRQSGGAHLLAWRWSFYPFAIYQPASSAVGLFQMTDGGYAEAARFCIRANAVTDTGCGFGPYIRAIPSHAIELASVYLDRNVAAVLARAEMTASTQQKQDVAAFIHLCGGGPATAFARRKFQMLTEERCGDHLVAAYVSRVNAMKRQFLRLAADGGK